MRSPSIRSRTKSKSVWLAAGKVTSISLKPMATSISNMRCLRAPSMGSNSAWLPSRRSVLIHIGGHAMTRSGQRRSASGAPPGKGLKGEYLRLGSFNMVGSPQKRCHRFRNAGAATGRAKHEARPPAGSRRFSNWISDMWTPLFVNGKQDIAHPKVRATTNNRKGGRISCAERAAADPPPAGRSGGTTGRGRDGSVRQAWGEHSGARGGLSSPRRGSGGGRRARQRRLADGQIHHRRRSRQRHVGVPHPRVVARLR